MASDDNARSLTGIAGLDELVEGGIPERSLVLVSGACGTGKSIFSLRYLVHGAQNAEPGVYVSLGERNEETIAQVRQFGWPVDKLVKEKRLLFVQPELYNYDELLTTVEDAVDAVKAKRLVIDSASLIGMYFENKFLVRKALFDMAYMLKRLGCTTFVTTEIREGSSELSTYGVEEYVADGVIMLHYYRKENIFLRALNIRKMRNTSHSTKLHPFRIKSPEGVVIYPKEELFEEI